jgi:hypothetical protein
MKTDLGRATVSINRKPVLPIDQLDSLGTIKYGDWHARAIWAVARTGGASYFVFSIGAFQPGHVRRPHLRHQRRPRKPPGSVNPRSIRRRNAPLRHRQPFDVALNRRSEHPPILYHTHTHTYSKPAAASSISAPSFSNTLPTRTICSSASFQCFCSMASRTPGKVLTP